MGKLALLKRKCAAVPLALSLLLAPCPADAQVPEAELKAAIIFNMLLFVEWPDQGTNPAEQLAICYLEDSPVATALIQLNGRSIKGRTLKIHHLAPGGAGACQALYLSPESLAGLDKVHALLGSSPVLLVADAPEYAQRGVMLNLELVAGRIVFDINHRAAQKAGLRVSSKALRLARQVIE